MHPVSRNATHSIVICLTIVLLVLGRLKIVESLELILAPRLHSLSNRTTHPRVLIQADTSGGRDGINQRNGINIVFIISFVALFTEVDRSYITFESHG